MKVRALKIYHSMVEERTFLYLFATMYQQSYILDVQHDHATSSSHCCSKALQLRDIKINICSIAHISTLVESCL